MEPHREGRNARGCRRRLFTCAGLGDSNDREERSANFATGEDFAIAVSKSLPMSSEMLQHSRVTETREEQRAAEAGSADAAGSPSWGQQLCREGEGSG